MRTKHFLFATAALLSMGFLTACDDEETTTSVEDETQQLPEGVVVWPADTVVNLNDHYTVPEGTTLVIKEGVQIIASTDGVGANAVPVEFTVNGNLICQGTEEKPILFSVDPSMRTEENQLAGLWGGIVATETCEEMLIDHTIIEYTGGGVTIGSPAATAGIYTADDDAYPQITTYNKDGRYVITNSVLRYGWSDGIYMMGGNGIIANNTFYANGFDGAEAVNVKAGCKVDVAQNVMFSPNTNGLKLSSSGQSEVRGQALIQAYNNTIINSGWRRDGEKGGCVYVEKNALANVFNNLIVNCKFRAMTPSFTIPNNPEEGYDNSSVIDYNYYASGSQRSDIVFADESGVAFAWEGYNYAHEDYNQGVVDAHSTIATETDSKDPKFVNFDINAVPLTSYAFDEDWDFHVQSDSPVLSGAYSGNDAAMMPYFQTEGLEVYGTTYNSPAVEARYGAFGE